ncbi:hypothetical protein ACFWN1_21415 [Streptomyces sp. NPDC058459]|uniref:hypothetical protein n=1 Tax=Streptomyces sp. NPDC058459 TaxID=3346508 RepID=UPI0036596659
MPFKHRKIVRAALIAATVVAASAISPLAQADDLEVAEAEVTLPAGGTNCEAAFAVQNYGGAPGTVGLISAGHCDTPGHVLFSSNADADFEVVNTGYNVVGTTSLPNGNELVSANYFRADWDNRSTWSNRDTSATSHPLSIGTANVGSVVCRFGGVSPKACGTVQSTNTAPRGAGFAADTFGYIRLDFGCLPGDSGAAVVSGDGQQAIGIISGRRKSDGACLVSQLNRIPAKVGGMELYQSPPADQKMWMSLKLSDKWYRLPGLTDRKTCSIILKNGQSGIDTGLRPGTAMCTPA